PDRVRPRPRPTQRSSTVDSMALLDGFDQAPSPRHSRRGLLGHNPNPKRHDMQHAFLDGPVIGLRFGNRSVPIKNEGPPVVTTRATLFPKLMIIGFSAFGNSILVHVFARRRRSILFPLPARRRRSTSACRY